MPASLRPDIAIDARARLGEGPVWDEQQQRLLWLDILPGLVHRLGPDLAVTKLLDGVTISNGLAWTADGATMYYIDSPTQGVDAFDYDAGTGRLANRRRVVDIPEAAGLPDGMTLDADGCLWIALYGGAAGHRYSPHRPLAAPLSFPATNITCPAFRGPGLRVLSATRAPAGLAQPQLAGPP